MSLYDIPDHPVIRNMERTGYPDGKEPEYPHCPVCEEREISDVYEQKDDGIIGCEACITRQAADSLQAFMAESPDGVPVCPVCKCQCEDGYTDRDGEIKGCDECVTLVNAWEKESCFYSRD